MRERRAFLGVKAPGNAPSILTGDGRSPGEINAGTVEESDPAIGIGQVNRRRKSLARVLERAIAFGGGRRGEADHVVRARGVERFKLLRHGH